MIIKAGIMKWSVSMFILGVDLRFIFNESFNKGYFRVSFNPRTSEFGIHKTKLLPKKLVEKS